MSSIGPNQSASNVGARRNSKASSVNTKSAMQRAAARDKRDAERSKRDRDLAMIAMMQAPAIQARAAQRDRESDMCSQLATRIIGGVSMFAALFMFVVAVIVTAQNCCGDHTKYNDASFKEECRTETDKLADRLPGDDDDSTERQSCYKRNVNTLIILSFAMYLLIVGVVVVVCGECMYSTEGAESREETRIEDLAGALKAQEIERRLQEREERRDERMELRELRDERRELREVERLEATKPKQRSPYAGGVYYGQRHSVGSPATVNTTPTYMTHASGPMVVQSAPRGRTQVYHTSSQPTYSYSQSSYTYGQSPRYVTSQSGLAPAPQPQRTTIRVVPAASV